MRLTVHVDVADSKVLVVVAYVIFQFAVVRKRSLVVRIAAMRTGECHGDFVAKQQAALLLSALRANLKRQKCCFFMTSITGVWIREYWYCHRTLY